MLGGLTMNKLKTAACGINCNEYNLYNAGHDMKAAESCGDCSDFPCEKYKEWTSNVDHHKKAMEYLLSLKTNT